MKFTRAFRLQPPESLERLSRFILDVTQSGHSLVDADRVLADVDPDLPIEEQVRAALRRAA